MGHNEFQIYKNILILTKTFWSKDTSHTHDLKYAIKHDKYLEHLVLCLFVEHTHTHTHTGWEEHSHRCFTESRLSGWIDRKLGYSLFQLEAATAAVVQHCTLQLSPPCLKKVS